jgi:hypothetical protein
MASLEWQTAKMLDGLAAWLEAEYGHGIKLPVPKF